MILWNFFKKLVPNYFRERLNISRYAVNSNLLSITKNVKPGIVIDAGAGPINYEYLFPDSKFLRTDMDKNNSSIQFASDLLHIPIKDNSVDTILNVSVLEHVIKPDVVIKEFYRILKPGGVLILSTTQNEPVHFVPHHYFNFTNFGLKYLFENAGFEIKSIKPLGGFFWSLARQIDHSLEIIYLRNTNKLFKIISYPLIIIHAFIFNFFIHFILFYLDFLDVRKDKYTVGYMCYCIKK